MGKQGTMEYSPAIAGALAIVVDCATQVPVADAKEVVFPVEFDGRLYDVTVTPQDSQGTDP